MKSVKKIRVGSTVFFEGYYEDFKPHDVDYICMVDYWDIQNTKYISINIDGDDYFMFENMNKDEIMNWYLDKNFVRYIIIGSCLVPEFVEYMNITIDDIKRLKHLFYLLDDRHRYETMIYNFYIENNSFTLTKEQRDKAYQCYKNARKQN